MAANSGLFKRVFLPALLVFAAAGFGARLATDREFRGMFDPDFLRAWWRVGQVMNLANQNYLQPDKANYTELREAALVHMLDGLDKYSGYLPAREFENLQNDGEQRLVGVGVEIERRHGLVQITRVFNGSPAHERGWLPGDRFVAVGGTSVRDMENASGWTDSVTVPRVSELLRGAADSTVRVVRERPGEPNALEDDLTRRGFDLPSLRDIELRSDGVGCVRLTQFGRHSGAELADAIKRLQERGMKGLVLDLRDNGGGLLEATGPVLASFLRPGALVTSTRGGPSRPNTRPIRVPGEGAALYSGPLAVLVNGNTASAAEIVAGALQDARPQRAVIVGEKTVGKGVVQSVFSLGDGTGVRLTTEEYYLPSGRSIHETGIVPDVPVPLSPGEWQMLTLQRAELRLLPPEPPAETPPSAEWEREVRARLKREAAAQFAARYGFAPRPDPQYETAAALVRAAFDKK